MTESNWIFLLIGIFIGIIVGGVVVRVIWYRRYKMMKEETYFHWRRRCIYTDVD